MLFLVHKDLIDLGTEYDRYTVHLQKPDSDKLKLEK